MYKFAAAAEREKIVFGAAKPKYSAKSVEGWLDLMKTQHIKRVCCLLEPKTLNRYEIDLLARYRQQLSDKSVLWQPIPDFQIPRSKVLIEKIIPFLQDSDRLKQKVVVHCAGGRGRTGIVLAAWLVSQRGMSNRQALVAVREQKRLPQEAVFAALLWGKNPWQVRQQLEELLKDCRAAFN